MNILLDVAVAAILILSVVSASKKGFFKTLLSGTAFLVALIITLIFSSPLRDAMLESGLHSAIQSGIHDSVYETVESVMIGASEKGDDALEALFTDEKLINVMESLGIDSDSLRESVSLHDGIAAAAAETADVLSVKLSRMAISAISVIGLFICSYVALKLLALLLTAVCQLPILKQANSLLGLLLGVLLGIIRVLVFVSVINLLIPVMQTSGSQFISAVDTAKTLLFQFFANLDILSFLS